MVLWDSARPESTATSTLTASIVRNEHGPEFGVSDYQARINDRYDLGQEIIVVSATDEDEGVRNTAAKFLWNNHELVS